MQDNPNNKEDHFLELNSAQKINFPLPLSLNKDPFPPVLILRLTFQSSTTSFYFDPFF